VLYLSRDRGEAMRIVNLLMSLFLVSCNNSTKVVATNPKKTTHPFKVDEVNLSEASSARFICTSGLLKSNFLVFRADAEPSVYPSLISLVTEAGSQQILGIEELEPLYSVSESTVKVVFRAKEYERRASWTGWQNYYYIADIDFLKRKITLKKIGAAPHYRDGSLLARDNSFMSGPQTHLVYFEKENKILLPLQKDGGFFYGWYSLETNEILSITNINALEYYNPVLDSPYLIFERRELTLNKYQKVIFNVGEFTPFPNFKHMGPTKVIDDDWLWLSKEGPSLKLINYSKQKSELKNFALPSTENLRIYSEARFSSDKNKLKALVAVEAPISGLGELRWFETDREVGTTAVLSTIAYPHFVKPVSKEVGAEMVIKGLFSIQNSNNVFASFAMSEGSTRLFRYSEKNEWQQVSRASCSNLKTWRPFD